MFARKSQPPKLRPVSVREETDLIRDLEIHPHENAYLLGLLHDYTLKGLQQMNWGNFYRAMDPYPQVLYQDVTGLVVLSRTDPQTISQFARLLNTATLRTTRIIANEETAVGLHTCLVDLSPRWKKIRVDFPEQGMILNPDDLVALDESELRYARPEEAKMIAEGSAHAMREEIGIDTREDEFDRLVRSKSDLIEKNRYFILAENGEILFQAYLSARLPKAGQIQGVWVPPEHRNKGIATRCLAAMCRKTFESCESIVLRVQTRNLPARAAYLKVGFKDFLSYRSIWFV
ncbi:MAG: GNAT family N-acetyltransferase [Candidatus Omnitrophica bacterium]|nr:GNAT family N-acetyltransferase [Candidatus Omnitrophota bacterium]MCB9783816.1 GNAT family N-acetyltransferase [Candidatus Omnitrophota bacterium]